MAAAYDTYDYPNYWEGRDYEHESEVVALKAFLELIPRIDSVLDIGGGFGRLTPVYIHRAKKIIISDPSSKLLAIARKKYKKDKKIKYLQLKADKLPRKVRKGSIDLAICVRVSHHIEDLDELIKNVGGILKDNGYFILEFANKCHLKALVSEFLRGNFTFALDISPKDISKKPSGDSKRIPFINYHAYDVKKSLNSAGFDIVSERSVSNVRSEFLKKHYSRDILLFWEKMTQKIFAKKSLGPSIFLLAQKRG